MAGFSSAANPLSPAALELNAKTRSHMRTRSQAAAELIVTLERLPDDTLQQMIDAFCDTANALPLF